MKKLLLRLLNKVYKWFYSPDSFIPNRDKHYVVVHALNESCVVEIDTETKTIRKSKMKVPIIFRTRYEKKMNVNLDITYIHIYALNQIYDFTLPLDKQCVTFIAVFDHDEKTFVKYEDCTDDYNSNG